MTTSATTTNRITIYQDRVNRLRKTIGEQHLDAFLVTNPENRRYLSGFTGHDSGADSAGALIITANEVALMTDGRYTEQAERECPGLRLIKREAGFAPLAAEALLATGATRIGFEATHLTVALQEDLEQALTEQAQKAGGKARPILTATRAVVEQQRVIKDALEIEAIERAVAITDATFAYLCGYLRPGQTERQIAQEIERYMLEQGADELAFASIVASGPNSALPHAIPGSREISLGEFITIDMGAKYDGYCSDMTRTVCMGVPGEELQSLYDLVLAAQETCEQGVRPGLTGQQADALARDIFEAEGRAEQYLHGTGHGLGLEIHENPRLSKFAAETVMEPGMLITIEPGLYVAGFGGVRIEDTAVVTEDGIRILTASHKRLNLPV